MVDGHQPLTDSQWQVIAPLLPIHRKHRHCLRQVLDAVRYTCRNGCQWRSLPAAFPPWSAVYYYFRRWQLLGRWQRLNEAVKQADRRAAGRPATPSPGAWIAKASTWPPAFLSIGGWTGASE